MMMHEMQELTHLEEQSAAPSVTGSTTSVTVAAQTPAWTPPTLPPFSKAVHKEEEETSSTSLIQVRRTLLMKTITPIFRTTKGSSSLIRSSPVTVPLLPLLIALPAVKAHSFRTLVHRWWTWGISVLWLGQMERLEAIAGRLMEASQVTSNWWWSLIGYLI